MMSPSPPKEKSVRVSLIIVPLALAAAFLIGRATSPNADSTDAISHGYTVQVGDVVRVPAAATRCLINSEAGAARLQCSHSPSARYEVVFYRNNLFVYRNGHPDQPVFSAQGKP
jgi:hypothetical protein